MNVELLCKELKKEKINAVLIMRDSTRVLEYYKNGKQKDKTHKINSCTKSIISILIGIAVDRKLIESIDVPVHTFFPKIFKDQSDKRKMGLTIRHLLTMTDGLDFPEFGEWNAFAPMVYHQDIVKFVIDRPLLHEVGTHMNYNSGCSHILSGILQQVTGMKTEDFANTNLFKPLGINKYTWHVDKMNINKGGDGLVLKVEDMEKIGQLMLQKGLYNGKRVVSEQWIDQSTSSNMITYEKIGYYGMHWWVNKIDEEKVFSEGNTYYFALGFGGQYIIVIPYYKIVITMTSDIYQDSLKPMRIIRSYFGELS